MNRLTFTRLVGAALLLFAVVPAFPDSLYVTIDTSAAGLNLQGPGVLAFELSDGPSTTDTITAGISNFNLAGGSVGTVIASQGVTGSFSAGSTSLTVQNGVSFGNPTQTSFYEQNVTFGSKLSLTASFALTPPASGPADATSDFLIVLAPPDFPATQIDAVDFIRDAGGNLTINFADPSAATVTPVPEPGSLVALGLTLLSLGGLWRRYRPSSV